MRTLRLHLAISVVAALGLVVASGAGASPPNFNAAEAVCSSSGGDVFESFPDGSYFCGTLPNLTDAQETRGRAVCEHAYGGQFIIRPSGYICVPT